MPGEFSNEVAVTAIGTTFATSQATGFTPGVLGSSNEEITNNQNNEEVKGEATTSTQPKAKINQSTPIKPNWKLIVSILVLTSSVGLFYYKIKK